MQMTLLAERENAFADFNESELRYFNQSLQRQLAELERGDDGPSGCTPGNLFGSLYHPNRNVMMRELEMERSSLKHRLQASGAHHQADRQRAGVQAIPGGLCRATAIDRDFDDADGFRWA